MIKKFKETLKPKKWEWIPFFGTIIFNVRINLFKNVQEKQFKKITFKWKSLFDLFSFIVSTTFLILFLTLRNKGDYGSWPWFFWFGVAWAIANNFMPFVPKLFIYPGFKTYIKMVESKEIEEDTPTTFKEANEILKNEKLRKQREKIEKQEDNN